MKIEIKKMGEVKIVEDKRGNLTSEAMVKIVMGDTHKEAKLTFDLNVWNNTIGNQITAEIYQISEELPPDALPPIGIQDIVENYKKAASQMGMDVEFVGLEELKDECLKLMHDYLEQKKEAKKAERLADLAKHPFFNEVKTELEAEGFIVDHLPIEKLAASSNDPGMTATKDNLTVHIGYDYTGKIEVQEDWDNRKRTTSYKKVAKLAVEIWTVMASKRQEKRDKEKKKQSLHQELTRVFSDIPEVKVVAEKKWVYRPTSGRKRKGYEVIEFHVGLPCEKKYDFELGLKTLFTINGKSKNDSSESVLYNVVGLGNLTANKVTKLARLLLEK